MKLQNVRILDEVRVAGGDGNAILRQYCQEKRRLDDVSRKDRGCGTLWLDLTSPKCVEPQVVEKITSHTHNPFIAVFVTYDLPDLSVNHPGLSRRQALSTLRALGLEAPTAEKTVILASQTIRTGEVRAVNGKDRNRRVMCPVPINPEVAYFYYFGMGFDSTGDFQKWNYCDEEGGFSGLKKDMYFWHDGPRLWPYTNPIIMGIKES